MKKLLNRFWPIIILILIEILLFVCNYKKGTFLIGWDNLYPELNFSVNIKRSFFSVWQEYRSLGYLDAMSHGANIIHDLFRFVISLFLPLNAIRWFFIFLMHLLGGVGIYFLMSGYVFKDNNDDLLKNIIALLCAVFYQFNLITIQTFFLPFEPFLIQFAFLPWLIYFALLFIDKGEKRHLILFCTFSLLSVSQAHVPTIFIVYMMAMFLMMITKLLLSKGKARKRILILILSIVFLNSFWGIPFAYATFKNAGVVKASKNNQMATEDIFYRNSKFGDFPNVITLKGVILDYWQTDYKTSASHFMMHDWLDYMQTWQFKVVSWMVVLLVFSGIFWIAGKKKRQDCPFLALFVFSFIMMATDVPVISSFSAVLREYLPLFGDIFRFVFTKFSILFIFSYTIIMGIGLYYLVDLLKKRYLKIAIPVVFLILIFIYTFPSFEGHFFYENLAVKIPDAYFDTFNFFNKQDKNTRIVLLPIPNYWAWTQNNWNTIGSGFFWYGINQPTTDRAFDPWNNKNENYYWELDQAIYSGNVKLLESVLEKYNISWLLLDKSVSSYLSAPRFDIEKYRNLLNQSSKIKPAVSYDFIDIFSFESENKLQDFIKIDADLFNINPIYKYDNYDQAYLSYGNYKSTKKKITEVYFPFRSLFSEKKLGLQEYQVEYGEDEIIFVSKISKNMSGGVLQTPSLSVEEYSVVDPISLIKQDVYGGEVTLDGRELIKSNNFSDFYNKRILLPDFKEGILKVIIKKNPATLYRSNQDKNFLNKNNDGCRKNPQGTSILENNESGLVFISQGSDNCVNFDFPDLSLRFGYLIYLKTQNSPIRGLYFNLINSMTKKTDLDNYLDHNGKESEYYFISSPRDYYGYGYTLNLDNISFGNEKIVNKVESLEVTQIPYYFLKETIIINNGSANWRIQPFIKQLSGVKKNNYFSYTVSLRSQDILPNGILYLSQGYDSGWIAWEGKMFFGKKLPHLLINNWENGWDISAVLLNQSTNTQPQLPINIYIFYWPQLLQYFGFILILGGIILIWRRKE